MLHIIVAATAFAGLANCGNTSVDTAANSQPAPANSAPLPANAAGGADWPGWHGIQRNAISPETGINKDWASNAPSLLWKAPMTDNGFAGPSVAGGMLYIIDHQGENDIVKALNMANGAVVWHYDYPDASSDNYGFSRSTPLVDSGNVYTVSRLGNVLCLEAKTGKLVWRKNLQEDFGGQKPNWDYAMSAVVDGDKLLVEPGGQSAMVALNKKTGATIWKGAANGAPGYATPAIAEIDGKKQAVTFMAKSVCGIDLSNGAILWNYPWETSYDVNAATPLVIGNSVFVTSGYDHGCALLDIKGGQATPKWTNRAMKAHFSSPIYYEGHIFGTGDPGILMCLNPADGSTLWKQEGFEKGGIMIADGTIIALSGNTGDLVMVKAAADGYHEMGRVRPLGEQSWTAPILAQGNLIVRNKTEVACVKAR